MVQTTELEYADFLKSKIKRITNSGFEVQDNDLNPMLFPFQRYCVKLALKRGRYALLADCGLGKTFMQLEWANKIVQRENKPILILTPLVVSAQTIQQGKQFGIEVNRWNSLIDNPAPAIYITNYEQLENIDVSHYVGVVLDECFAPDTKIKIIDDKGHLQEKDIKDCLVGEKVLNCTGFDTITEVKKKKINYAIKIGFNGKEFITSGRHPYFTQRGWVAAKELQDSDVIVSTDKAMRILRGELSNNIQSRKKETILRDILFSEMANETARNSSESSLNGSEKKEGTENISMVQNRSSQTTNRVYTKFKPNGRPANESESICYPESDGTQTFSAWGEWTRNDIASAINEGCIVRELGSGICHIFGQTTKGLPDKLQSRFSELRNESCNRSRWELSLQQKRDRQEEGRETGYFGLESFEVLEQTDTRLDKYRDAEGSLYFYDLSIKRHPSFTINECLVHNSGVLKNFTGATKKLLIEKFAETPYKLCCTATPAPNDLNEIGNHSEFLNVLDAQDMRSKWFVRDEGMNNYRLKGHAKKDFYGWVSSWATMMTSPKDLGFDNAGYDLPQLNYIEREIKTTIKDNGRLFNEGSVNATNFNAELRLTKIERFEEVASIVNNSTEQFIIWVKQNIEGELACKLIPDAIEVSGSDDIEYKEKTLLGFANKEFRVLVTKQKIASFGMNFQNCHNQIFASLDFSFEQLYQAIRRSYRFGQKHDVNIYIITTDTMENVLASIKHKEKQFIEMQTEMNLNINEKRYGLLNDYTFAEVKTDDYWLMKGDSCTEIKRIPDNSVDFIVFSPPFSSLFTYSNYIHDMGNNDNHAEFFKQYAFLLKDLYRILKPGRLMCCHTKDLGVYKNSSGYTGMYDFTGEHTRAVLQEGFKLHSKITIWTDPVLEMQRTKTQRLLYKTVTSDSTDTGIGMAEYVTIFKKWSGDESTWTPVTNLNKKNFPLDTWQKWASPVWMDILRTDVLNGKEGTAMGDEKHIAPLQLEVIHRLVNLYTNQGETVFTPFLGIGSEAYMSIKNDRKAIGIELKDSYFETAVTNVQKATQSKTQTKLFL